MLAVNPITSISAENPFPSIAAVGEPAGRKANWLENTIPDFTLETAKLDIENIGQRLIPRCG